ncbi:hypothetical protein V2J09_011082 [Rumex salicifolius]
MHSPEMKAFRLLRLHSNLLAHSNRSRSPLCSSSLPKPYSNPQFSPHLKFIHSLNRKSCPEPSPLDISEPIDASTSTSPITNPKRPAWSAHSADAESSGNEEDGVENQSKSSNSVDARRGSGGLGNFVFGRKKGKSKVHYVCSNCGQSYGQWWGTCSGCNQTGTINKFLVPESVEGKVNGFVASESALQSWLPEEAVQARPMRLRDVNRMVNQNQWRISLSGLFGAEISRVLGGGVVPGSLTLIGGDPGVGKSTLLLQIAAIIAEDVSANKRGPVLYVSGEESIEQIGQRADRMRITTEELFLYSSTDIEDIIKKVRDLSTRALIVDSIQTVYLKGVTGSPGGIQQVKECTSALLRFAKSTNIPVLLIGHVNKSGEIAGPRVLEHIVDAVLYMEGEKHSSHRLLRSVKNRFGPTDELGVFEMSQAGLQAVTNASEIFLSEQHSDSEHLAGLAVAVIVDGSRAFVVEVQALCVSNPCVSRHVTGVPSSRADMIISVLMKQASLRLDGNAVYINVVNGVSLTEPAGDLAVAVAICSSFLEVSVPNNAAFVGEIGLGGELRMVSRIEKRVQTVAKLGYKMCVVPKSAEETLVSLGIGGLTIIGCRNVKEVIDKVFKSGRG